MKRSIIIFMAGIIISLTGCEVSQDYVFDDISTHRITQYIEKCDEVIKKAPHGWKFVYYPDTAQYGGFTFLIKFLDNNRVQMCWDGDNDTIISSYSFNTSSGPVLNFDSYSLLHRLADPNPGIQGGKAGLGYKGEFEYMITEVKDYRIDFVTKDRKKPIFFTLATQEEWDQLEQNRKMRERFMLDRDAPFYNYLQLGDKLALFLYSEKLRMAYLAYEEGGKTISRKIPWYTTPRGIMFMEPITFQGLTFSEVAINNNRELRIVDIDNDARFFRATDHREDCLVRLPGAVEMARGVDGFNLVERGRGLDNFNFLSGGNPDPRIEDFRFYWKLVGYAAMELYMRTDQGICLYAGLFIASIVDDGVGDQVTFQMNTFAGRTNNSGPRTNEDEFAFGTYYRYGPMSEFLRASRGLTVLPFQGQFYMIKNGDNLCWALYSPKEGMR